MSNETSPYTFSFVDAMTKLHWGTAGWQKQLSETRAEWSLLVARNTVTGVQVLVMAEHAFTLVVDRANWLSPQGLTPRVRLAVDMDGLAQGAVEVLPVGYVEGDDHQQWMEYFDRAGYADVPAGRPQAVYIRMRVGTEVVPGQYIGTVRAFAQQGFEDEALLWEGKLALEVSEVALPDVKDYTFQLNLWQHLTSIARYHHVALWSESHFTLIERYYASLAQLGQKVVSLVVTEIPWSGQRCYRDPGYPSYLFEHAVVGVTRARDGALRCDYSALDRLLDLAARYHMDSTIDVFGLLNIWVDEEYGFGKVAPDAPDAVRVRCYDEAAGTFTYLRTAGELRSFIRALQDHFASLGVLERVRVAADEPGDLAAFNRSLAFVREAAPGFQYSAAINHFEFLQDAPPEVKDFTPILPMACQDPGLTARLAADLRRRGGKMTWYICCWPPIPNTFIHSPLVEGRLLGWLTHALGLDGFLRWAFCLWPESPWERVSWRAPDWSAGDMFFVLPGKDGAPVETLRYEALRQAVQDYELIKLVERRLGQNQAAEVINQALGSILRAPSLADFAGVTNARAGDLYSLEPADYEQAKKMLIEAIG